MIDSFLRGALGLGVLVITAGIVAAPLTGSDRAFEFAPVLSAGRGVWNWLSHAGQEGQKPEVDPKPMTEEAKDAAGRLQQATTKALGNLPVAQDPRLSICTTGSIEPKNAKEIPLATAIAFKQQVDQGKKKPSFIDVQAALGEPACNIRKGNATQWRYIAPEARIIDATQGSPDQPLTLRFTNF